MKLYYSPLSVFSSKIKIALDEKGLEHETRIQDWTVAGGWQKLPDVISLNPKAEIPVLVDGDVRIYDSTIIFEYLEERYPKPPLYPASIADRARCRILEDMGDTMVAPHLGVLVNEVFKKPDPATRNQTAVAQTESALRRCYELLNRELAGREYLCGAFSVADIGCFVHINLASGIGVPPQESCTDLKSWFSRVQSRPSVARLLAEFTQALAKLTPAPQPQSAAR
jgi:glutathione S-transferase